MNGDVAGRRGLHWLVAICAPLLLLFAQTILKVRYGLNLADEGFLWYGAQRSLAGEVPIRDFMAYDPGRYYWTALWMWVARDDGIIAMRWSAVIFEAVAVSVTSLAVWRDTRNVSVAVLSSASCVLLMSVWHARYEPSVALLQVVVLAHVLKEPTDARFFMGGVQVGLSAFFGRNLALYGLLGLLAVLVLVAYLDHRALSWRRVALVVAGGLVGALPLVAMGILVPGFATAFWQSIVRHFELGATNLPLPYPWPWALEYESHPWSVRVAMFLYGSLHVAMLVIGVGTVAWAVSRNRLLLKKHALFTAAAILSVPYAHYAFSRASMEHLIRAGAPVILALAIVPLGRHPRWRAVPALLVAAILAYIRPINLHGTSVVGGEPSLSPAEWLSERSDCRDIIAGADHLCVQRHIASAVEGARSLVDHFVHPGESVLIAPFDPGLYPVLGLKAPNWELFALFPAQPRFEIEEIQRIEAAHTRMAILAWYPLDGRPELHFSSTHPLISAYLSERYGIVEQDILPPSFVVVAKP